MHRAISFLSATAVAAVTSLAAGARADEPSSALAPPPSESAESEAHPSFEFAAGFSPVIGFGNLGGLGSVGLALRPNVDIGIGLSDRVFLVFGGRFSFSDDSFSETVLSVRLQIYLAEPTPGSVVPMLRAGVGGLWGTFNDNSLLGGSVLASAGITWLASRALGLRLEIGGRIDALGTDSSWFVSGDLDASAAVVVRL